MQSQFPFFCPSCKLPVCKERVGVEFSLTFTPDKGAVIMQHWKGGQHGYIAIDRDDETVQRMIETLLRLKHLKAEASK